MAASSRKNARSRKSIRYLKLIAIFKILNGLLLVLLGFSLLFITTRTGWLEAISAWTDEELLLGHSRPVLFLLNKLQGALANGQLGAPAVLALIYAVILFVEGFGVYFQKRWAEYLMVFATGALIPLEVRHLWHRPGLAAALILAINCAIVAFLYYVLRRDATRRDDEMSPLAEVSETR